MNTITTETGLRRVLEFSVPYLISLLGLYKNYIQQSHILPSEPRTPAPEEDRFLEYDIMEVAEKVLVKDHRHDFKNIELVREAGFEVEIKYLEGRIRVTKYTWIEYEIEPKEGVNALLC